MIKIDDTHALDLTSWVDSANVPGSDFPIQNLPFGCFRRGDREAIGVAIGEQIVDLGQLAEQRLNGVPVSHELGSALESALASTNLNALMALERSHWQALRVWLSSLLSSTADSDLIGTVESCLVAQSDVEMLVPATVGDYTDFYASIFHATNVGSLFRPDNPLLPNYKHIPIGYHGRASTIVPSGTPVHRPYGQLKGPQDALPSYGPCRLLDYEMEVGLWIGGAANAMGETVAIDAAEDRLFGVCLLNDWSARDIQGWEYQPLGPFLAKSFATTVSPWVITLEALAPFRCGEFQRDPGDPAPLPYLQASEDNGGLAIQVEVFLTTPAPGQVAASSTAYPPPEPPADPPQEEVKLSATSVSNLYWTPAQMVTHHASNGCTLNPGDLLGTGTVSGPGKSELGSMLEITRRGQEPLSLPNGDSRKMLEDGDEVIMRGFAEAPGRRRIGFGECRGTVVGATMDRASFGLHY